jgi:hypothetical protein
MCTIINSKLIHPKKNTGYKVFEMHWSGRLRSVSQSYWWTVGIKHWPRTPDYWYSVLTIDKRLFDSVIDQQFFVVCPTLIQALDVVNLYSLSSGGNLRIGRVVFDKETAYMGKHFYQGPGVDGEDAILARSLTIKEIL